MPQTIQRVLIYRLGSLGDTVVALPSLHLVARAFPDAERRMLTNIPISVKAAAAAAILDGNGLVQGYFRYTVGTRSPWALIKLWWQLVRWRPQVLVYLAAARGIEAAARDAKFFRLCGIRRQIGVPLTEAMQLNRREPGAEDVFEPECERLARNLAELGDANMQAHTAWDLRLTEAEHARAQEVLAPAAERPLLALSIGTKLQANDWGTANWRALLQVLGRRLPNYALVLTGAAVEKEGSDLIASGWREGSGGSPVLNLCGMLSPRESAACFARARVFMGHDSGPMHLAAAVGTPCVAVFSARNRPRIWFPYGSRHRVLYHAVDCMGCGLETCTVQAKKCLTSITVEEVAQEVEEVLSRESVLSALVSSK